MISKALNLTQLWQRILYSITRKEFDKEMII